jgi:4-amino-4-deoxy-L-arabinose transferase
MDKIIIDLLILLALLGGMFFIARLYLSQRTITALLVILCLGGLLRSYLAQDQQLHEWDERYHALVAKNLVEHPTKPTLYDNPVLPYDDTDWVNSHLWFSKPPLPLWAMAGSIAVFGNDEVAIRIPSIIISLLGIFMIFLIGRELFNDRVGLIAAFLFAINGLLVELAAGIGSSDHVETMFIVMVEVAIYFSILSVRRERALKWVILTGVFTGLAFLSKWFPAFLVFPVWFVGFILSDKFNWKKLFGYGLVILLSTALVILPWILNVNSYGDNILDRVLFAFGTSIQGHERPIWYYFHEILITFGELIYIPLIFGVYWAIKGKSKQAHWIVLIWIFIPLIVFTLGATKRYTYILISAPAFFMIIAYLFHYLLENYTKLRYKYLTILVAVALIALPLRFSIERLKLFRKEPTLSTFYETKDDWQDSFNDNDIVVGCPEYIELMFYTDVKAAYSFIPDSNTLTQLRNEGHEIFVYSEGGFEEY